MGICECWLCHCYGAKLPDYRIVLIYLIFIYDIYDVYFTLLPIGSALQMHRNKMIKLPFGVHFHWNSSIPVVIVQSTLWANVDFHENRLCQDGLLTSINKHNQATELPSNWNITKTLSSNHFLSSAARTHCCAKNQIWSNSMSIDKKNDDKKTRAKTEWKGFPT